MSVVQILITIAVFPLMMLSGFYAYRALNRKLLNAESWIAILTWAILLFAGVGAILFAGFYVMILLFQTVN